MKPGSFVTYVALVVNFALDRFLDWQKGCVRERGAFFKTPLVCITLQFEQVLGTFLL